VLISGCALTIQFSKTLVDLGTTFHPHKFNKHDRKQMFPTISVDLGLFRGKKYLDFKNFSFFVNTKDKKFRKILDLFESFGRRLWVAIRKGGARGRQPKDCCFFRILKMTASFPP
jgi:hypothetical protein